MYAVVTWRKEEKSMSKRVLTSHDPAQSQKLLDLQHQHNSASQTDRESLLSYAHATEPHLSSRSASESYLLPKDAHRPIESNSLGSKLRFHYKALCPGLQPFATNRRHIKLPIVHLPCLTSASMPWLCDTQINSAVMQRQKCLGIEGGGSKKTNKDQKKNKI